MKRLSFLGMFLLLVGFAGSGFAQTANQYIEAGNQYYASKDYAKAVQYYQAAAQMDPNSAAAWQGLGNSQYSQGQNADALASYQKALAINPNNTQLSTFVDSLKAKVAAAPASSSVAVPTPAQSTAASPAASSSSAGKFELDVNAGVAFATGITGFGGGLGGYIPLGTDFSIGAMAGFYTFSEGASASNAYASASASASINFLEVMAAAKYRINANGFHPYLFGGVGIADVMTSASETVSGGGSSASASASDSAIDPMVCIGGGVEFPMGNNMNFFAQGKYSVVFVPGVTVDTGYGTVTAGGGTSTYLPLEVGLDFNM